MRRSRQSLRGFYQRTRGIPQRQLDRASVNVDLRDIVLEHCRDVELRCQAESTLR